MKIILKFSRIMIKFSKKSFHFCRNLKKKQKYFKNYDFRNTFRDYKIRLKMHAEKSPQDAFISLLTT